MPIDQDWHMACAEITYLGKQRYVTLRDLVATALNKYHKWANRSMALFLHDSELDPFIHLTLNQIKQARRALSLYETRLSRTPTSGQYGPMSALQWHLLNLVATGLLHPFLCWQQDCRCTTSSSGLELFLPEHRLVMESARL